MLTGWATHKEITVAVGKYPADGAAFDMPVLFNGQAEIIANLAADGSDVRASLPDGTLLDDHIGWVDQAAGSLMMFVSLPASDGINPTIIHIDIGNPAATNNQNSAAVYPTHSVMALLAGTPPAAANGTAADSSPVATAGNIVGTMAVGRTLSPLGLGWFDDGAGNEIEFNANSFNPYAFTVSWWSADVGAGAAVNLTGLGQGAEDVLRCDVDGAVPEISGKTDWLNSGGWVAPITPTGWHRHSITYDDTTATMTVYEDGVQSVQDVGGAMPAGIVGSFSHFGARGGSVGGFVRDVASIEIKSTINTPARELAYFQAQNSPSTFYSESAWLPNITVTYTVSETFLLADGSPLPDGVAVRAYVATSFPTGLQEVGTGSTAGGAGSISFTISVPDDVILIADYNDAGMAGQVAMSLAISPVVT